MSAFRVLVCGGRDYKNRESVFDELHLLAERHGVMVVIQGGATGADAFAREWAFACRHELINYPADWQTLGRAAGPIRNQRMLDHGKPDLVLAFPGGRGTADMVAKAKAAGVLVMEIAP